MIRGTTPSQTFDFDEGVLDTIDKLVITYTQNEKIILEYTFTAQEIPVYRHTIYEPIYDEKTGEEIGQEFIRDYIEFNLSQEETYLFEAGIYYMQLKALDNYGRVVATRISRCPVLPVLNEDVI